MRILVLALFACPYQLQAQQLPVMTSYGVVTGTSTSRNGEQYGVFLGVPYAKPPVGELRFEKAQPPDPWLQPRDATRYGPRCMQLGMDGTPDFSGTSEDCLTLNIFSPGMTSQQRPAASFAPVIVYLHAGGFVFGSSQEPSQNSVIDLYVSKGVVFVSVNYRLGLLGFWSSGGSIAPGNYGLWDVTQALKWVKQEINKFGGDPNQITVMGYSAGSISASLLSMSPITRDYMRRTIEISGSALNPQRMGQEHTLWKAVAAYVNCGPPVPNDELAEAGMIAPTGNEPANQFYFDWSSPKSWSNLWTAVRPTLEKFLGQAGDDPSYQSFSKQSAGAFDQIQKQFSQSSSGSDPSETGPLGQLDRLEGVANLFSFDTSQNEQKRTLECLRALPLQALMDAQQKVTIGNWHPRPDGILFPKSIDKLSKDRSGVDVLLGTTTAEEADLVLQELQFGNPVVASDEQLFNRSILGFIADADLANPQVMEHVFRWQYIDALQAERASQNVVQPVDWMVQDIMFKTAMNWWVPAGVEAGDAYENSKTTGKKVYLYSFGHVSELENFPIQGWRGALHQSMLKYLFEPGQTQPTSTRQRRQTSNAMNGQDVQVRELFTQMLVNFAVYGNPTPISQAPPLIWNAVNSTSLNFLFVTSTPAMRNKYHVKDILFWNDLVLPLQQRLCL